MTLGVTEILLRGGCEAIPVESSTEMFRHQSSGIRLTSDVGPRQPFRDRHWCSGSSAVGRESVINSYSFSFLFQLPCKGKQGLQVLTASMGGFLSFLSFLWLLPQWCLHVWLTGEWAGIAPGLHTYCPVGYPVLPRTPSLFQHASIPRDGANVRISPILPDRFCLRDWPVEHRKVRHFESQSHHTTKKRTSSHAY